MSDSKSTFNNKTPGLIISVEKARRILGELSKTMDDNQVIYIIHSLHLLAREQMCYNGSKVYGKSSNE